MQIKEILEKLSYIKNTQVRYKDILLRFQENKTKMEKLILSLEEELILNKESKEYYSKAIDLIYQESLGKLEETINLGLSYIFYDKNYSIKFELGDKRNKSLKMFLIDNESNTCINLKKGTGAGVRSVISFIFLIYYLISKNSYPVIFLDESYSQISADYVENFFSFMKKLCKEKDFIIVMITHDERFINYSDYIYTISEGKVVD